MASTDPIARNSNSLEIASRTGGASVFAAARAVKAGELALADVSARRTALPAAEQPADAIRVAANEQPPKPPQGGPRGPGPNPSQGRPGTMVPPVITPPKQTDKPSVDLFCKAAMAKCLERCNRLPAGKIPRLGPDHQGGCVAMCGAAYVSCMVVGNSSREEVA